MWLHALHIHFQYSNLIQIMTSINYFSNSRLNNRFCSRKKLINSSNPFSIWNSNSDICWLHFPVRIVILFVIFPCVGLIYVKDIFFINVWRKNIFDIYVTEYGTALTTVLPILFLYLNTVVMTAGTFEP